MPRAVRVVISGRVQGVWYRGWTCEQAGMLGLIGWVRNRRDGTVEALFLGEADNVETMIARCQDGPPAARVIEVRVETADVDRDLSGFEARPTV